ncbi:tetratricopeptide repeat protein [Goodfellowiella coeruleoviolacea]|uniref:Tetratricopeptide repeat-containing protein n=1 Tax=Goodfellowiella coeruleoviolacea TaxID=334858 RepID=A0AAE3KM82_9PSEU|nr:tetratricopeptide repeat protein [Goodfellowiella coeruleoviolacea]MCP2167288.1 Tetratricopeptide repeat-containing protein [Goodfellowiella coeruleoviolacea]
MGTGAHPPVGPTPSARSGFHEAYSAVGGTGLPQKGGQSAARGSRTIEPPLDLLPRDIQGRDALKPELVAALTPRRRGIRVLHGIAGGGKSSLALWLARQARDQGRPVYWVGNGDVEQSMHAVAVRCGVDVGQVGRADAQDVVWRALENASQPWLLVFDNIDDVERRGLLGASGAHLDGTGWIRPSAVGLVLVTTRRGDRSTWGEHAELTRVTCLAGVDGARVLLDLAPDAGPAEDARLLADQLGGLPLALRLAGHYLANDPPRHRTFGDYRRAVRGDLDLLDAGEPTPATLLDDDAARRSIRLTWELSLALLEERRLGQARPLLHLLACYGAPHPIPLDLLVATHLHGTPVDPDGTLTDGRLAQLVRGLVSSALADQTDVGSTPHLALHPLLAEVVAAARDESPHADDTWTAAVALLAETAPGDSDPSQWTAWQALPAVIAAVLARVPARLDAMAVMVQGGNLCAAYLLRTGAFQASHDMSALALRRATVLPARHPARLQARLAAAVVGNAEGSPTTRGELAALWDDARAELAEDHPFLVAVRQQLAEALCTAGEFEAAEEVYRDLLADHDRGIAAEQALATRFGYGRMMCLRGHFDVAEREISAVLAAERELFDDPDHPELLLTRALLADIWLGRGELVKARDELQDVLRAQERVHGPDSPLTLSARVTLMAVHSQLRDRGGAEIQLSQLLRIQRDALNPEHPLSLLGLAALINTRAHDPAVAADPRTDEQRLTEVAAAMARQMGEDHPFVLSTRLGAALRRCEYDQPAGIAAVRAVLARQADVLGPVHIATLNTRLLYAQLLVRAGEDNAAAEEELRDLLDTQLGSIGADNPQTVMARTTLANIALSNGDRDGAEALLREALGSWERLHGPDHTDARELRLALVQVLCLGENVTEAEQQLLTLIASLRRTEPDSDQQLAAQVMLALVRMGDHRADEAERELRQVLATVAGLATDHRYDRLMVQWFLAEVLRVRSADEEAEALLTDSVAGLVELGDPDDDVASVRLSYAELLHDTGRLAEAERQLQLVLANVAADDERAEPARVLLQAVSAQLAEPPEPEPPEAEPAEAEPVEREPAEPEPAEPEPETEPVSAHPAPPAPGQPAEASPLWLDFLAGTGPRPDGAGPADDHVEATAVPRDPVPTGPVPRDPVPRPAAPDVTAPPATRDEPEPSTPGPSSPATRAPDVPPRQPAPSAGVAGSGYREDLRRCAEIAARLRERGLADLERAHLGHRYGLLLVDLGFPVAAHAQLCAASAAHQRLDAAPEARLACLADLALAGPVDDGAIARIDRAEQRVTAELGPDHPVVLRLRRGRAELWTLTGAAPRAVAELTDVLARTTRPDAERAALRRALAVAVWRAGDHERARGLHRDAVAAYARLPGEHRPHLLRARADLAACGERPAEAVPVLRDIITEQVRLRGAAHPDVAASRHHLGVALAAAGAPADAIAQLAGAVRLFTRRLGARHPSTLASGAELARVRRLAAEPVGPRAPVSPQ